MLYFYHGSDSFRIREALKAGIAETKKKFGVPPDAPVFRLDAEDKDPEQIFSYLGTQSLFDRYKIAVVERLGEFPKSFRDSFAEYAKASPIGRDEAVAVFVTYTTKEKASKEDTALISSFTAKPFHVTRFDALAGSELARWIAAYGKSRNLVISPRIAAMLAVRLGSDTGLVACEIEKLALYLGVEDDSPKEVGAEHLAFVGTGGTNENAFKLVDAIGERKASTTLRILQQLFGQGEDPVKILGLLVYAVRAMLSLKDAESRQIRPADIPKLTGLADWQARQYRKAASRFTLDDLKKLYERLMATDYKIKTGEGNPRMLLENFLLRV